MKNSFPRGDPPSDDRCVILAWSEVHSRGRSGVDAGSFQAGRYYWMRGDVVPDMYVIDAWCEFPTHPKDGK